MRVFIINPSNLAFGTAIITPRWLYVLAAATPEEFGDPILVDETLEQFDADQVEAGDIVCIHKKEFHRVFNTGFFGLYFICVFEGGRNH